MRLICPNCGAQYDVPTEVIPEGGRDVQCSSCGHTWFQNHPDQDADLAEELNQPLPEVPEAVARAADPLPEAVPPIGSDALSDSAPKRKIDPEMAELFREERDYEVRQRAAEGLESQPDLGLAAPDEDEQARRSRQARERMAMIRGDEMDTPRPAPRRPAAEVPESGALPEGRAAAAAAAAAAAGSRRDLLPDVEEINQTLRAEKEPRVIDAAERSQAPAEPESGGFGKGFLLMAVIAAALIGTYVMAPDLGEQIPAAAPYLESYVATVDKGRVWLDGQVTGVLQMLDGMSSEAAQGEAAAPDDSVPDESAPDETSPVESVPEVTAPDEAAPASE